MSDQNEQRRRRLKAAPETVRERAERIRIVPNRLRFLTPITSRVSYILSWLVKLPVWKPLRWISRFLIPPYLRSSWRELQQVTWPNRRQTRQLTGAVIVFALVFGIIVAAFDYGLDKMFREVIIK